MNPKVVFLLLLVCASIITTTAFVVSASVPTLFNRQRSVVVKSSIRLEPLGDPIDDPTPPHVPK